MSEQFHYWSGVVEVVGPLPHLIHRETIMLRTGSRLFNKVDFASMQNYAISHVKEKYDNCTENNLRVVTFGPYYLGFMTPLEFEGMPNNE